MPAFSLACLRLGRALARRNRLLDTVLRLAWRPLRRVLMPRYPVKDPSAYELWLTKHDRLLDHDRAAILRHIETLPAHPHFIVFVPIGSAHLAELGASIAAIKSQLYGQWEARLVARGQVSPEMQRGLERIMAAEPRLRLVVREGARDDVAAGLPAGGAAGAEPWVVPVMPGDLLPPHALYEFAVEINSHPAAKLIYADEDRLDGEGKRCAPYFKSDFDPELLLVQNYMSGIMACRADIVAGMAGLPIGEAAPDWHETVLYASFLVGANAIRHVPAVLCHRQEKAAEVADDAGAAEEIRLRVERFLESHDIAARAVPVPGENHHRIVWPLPVPAPLVSAIIPTRDRAELLGQCLAGILTRTDYPALEVIIADNDSSEPETAALYARLAHDPRVRILSFPGPFNYSRLNNRAVEAARGEILLLLNNDTNVIAPLWLREMVANAVRPEIGAVGAKLLYGNDHIQHAGVILGMGWPEGVAGHYFCDTPNSDPGDFDLLRLTRSASAVTAACLAVRKSLFLDIGGLDEENLTVAFNDVDFCLRLRERGYRNLWTPHAMLYHLESASRGKDASGEKARRYHAEIAYMRAKWADALNQDPYWNPNLALQSGARDYAPFPRRPKPWRNFPETRNSRASSDTSLDLV